jgi:glutathione S-transferase
MILYGSSFSPFVRKVLVYAAEKGITLQTKQPGRPPEFDPDFVAASPLKKMPALVDGDFALADSTAIITYLEALHPSPPLMPADPKERARAVWFEEFADTELGKVMFKTYFNRIVAPRFRKQPGDEGIAVEGETKDLPPLLHYLETVAPPAGGFLAGGALSVADISVASMFVNFEQAGVKIDTAKFPKTTAWVQSIHARPSMATLIETERRILSR